MGVASSHVLLKRALIITIIGLLPLCRILFRVIDSFGKGFVALMVPLVCRMGVLPLSRSVLSAIPGGASWSAQSSRHPFCQSFTLAGEQTQ